MPSSTSSSSARLPGRAGSAQQWWLVAALFIGALTGWELLWRSHGFEPTVRDTEARWIRTRGDVETSSIVLVGTSRIQGGVDRATLEQELGRRVHQLALIGTSPLPVVEDLAADETFAGWVIVDFIPWLIFDQEADNDQLAVQYVVASRSATSPSARLDESLGSELDRLFAFRNSAVAPRAVLAAVRRGRLPAPYYVMHGDRFRTYDFSLVDARGRNAILLEEIARTSLPDADRYAAIVEGLARAATRLESRGGRLILLRLPVAEEVFEAETKRFSRATYWDAVLAASGAEGIHWRDDPTLTGFNIGDGSHLDRSALVPFSAALADVLVP